MEPAQRFCSSNIAVTAIIHTALIILVKHWHLSIINHTHLSTISMGNHMNSSATWEIIAQSHALEGSVIS